VNAIAEQRVRPGKTGYWIALLIFVLGVGGSGYALYDGISSLSEGLVRAVVPSELTPVSLEAGSYTVFHESPSVFEGQTYNAPLPAALDVYLLDGEERIPMSPSVGSLTYDLPGRSGRSIGRFEIERAGEYRLGADVRSVAGGEWVIALGHEKGKATVKTAAGIAGVLASGLIAVLIFVIVLIMRSRSKNRLREAGVQA
jgi:hypothetical protein